MSDDQDVLSGQDAGGSAEPGQAQPEADEQPEPDEQYERFSRARLYTVIAGVAVALTAWYMVRNLFLAPVVGIVGAFASWRGIKNGGNRRLLLVLMVICLIPALIAIAALISLLPGLPSLKLSGVKFVDE